MKIPKWLNSYLKESELEKIEQAVKNCEKRTAGEIVPMVVEKSSTVGHVPMILLFFFMTVFFAFDLYHLQMDYLDLPDWLFALIDITLLLILVRLFSASRTIQRILTPKQDQALQVQERAMVEFYNHRLHHTENATGILIFVSIMEHRAVVLGDDPISKKLPAEKWQEALDRLIAGIKTKNMAQGLIDAIDMSGDMLAEHFPIQKDNVNELRNHLVIKS